MSTQRWWSDIDQITQNFVTDFGDLSEEDLNWKPSPKVWSIAQNIDHLMVINNTYYPVIESVRNNTYTLPWIGKIGFMVDFMGKIILGSVRPDRKKKMKTFPLWEPASSNVGKDIFQRFKSHQERLKVLISDTEDLVQKGTVISSPANKNIVYKLETAFDIIITHEKRHLEQARELLQLKSTGKK
jgi:hypothetical protein